MFLKLISILLFVTVDALPPPRLSNSRWYEVRI